jgi:hypothetical protein
MVEVYFCHRTVWVPMVVVVMQQCGAACALHILLLHTLLLHHDVAGGSSGSAAAAAAAPSRCCTGRGFCDGRVMFGYAASWYARHMLQLFGLLCWWP